MTELVRWQLILGRYAAEEIGAPGPGTQAAEQAAALDYLYQRAHAARGARGGPWAPGPGGTGGSDPQVIEWLGEVRELFGNEVADVIVEHALQRFGLTEVVADPAALAALSPSPDLLRLLLTLRRSLPASIDAPLRQIVREVVDEIRRRIEPEVRRVLVGSRRSFTHSPIPVAANFDVAGTIRRNLKNYDPQRERLVVEELRFFDRQAKQLTWEVIVCIDQSGSMADSVLHSAVMSAILAGLPAFRVKLVVFDTSVVDLSPYADDPISILMTVQLGGGTDIGQALRYCSTLVENPKRTVLVLITDFCEGGSPSELFGVVTSLSEAGVRLLGLAALSGDVDGSVRPSYDRAMANQLADRGMQIAALTPRELADWLVSVTS